jgi:hypothetical protein
VKLNAALSALGSSQTAAACGELQSFINLVDAQTGKAIILGDAASLIEDATRRRAVIGC